MQTWMIVALVCIAALVVGWIIYDQRRTRMLKARFGPAYDQTVSELGNRRRAEARLQGREAYVRELRARPMNPSDRAGFVSRWKQCQALFVDDPGRAVEEADDLVAQLMRFRGYAADTPYERTTDIAAAFPHDVERYRQAGEIIERHHSSSVSTDALRTAFLHYRNLFEDLIGENDEKLKRAS